MKKKLTITAVILGVLYLAGAAVFSFRTFPRTEVNGHAAGFQDVTRVFQRDYSEFVLEVQGREENAMTLAAKDIHYAQTPKGDVALKQNPWLWPLGFFKTDAYTIAYDISYDAAKLDAAFQKSTLVQKARPPKNAEIEKVGQAFEIIPEDHGTTLDLDKAKDMVLEAISAYEETLDLEAAYLNASILKDDAKLNENLAWMNKIAPLKYDFVFGDQVESLEADALLAMFDEGDSGYVLNAQRLRDYVRDLAIKYDTWNTERTFTTTGGSQITTGQGAMYGWQMNVDKTRDKLVTMLEATTSGPVEIEWNHKAQAWTPNDIGTSYIEISISQQKMWMYRDGQKVVETDVVTGTDTESRRTPTGLFKVWSRETDRYLSGNNAQSGSYRSHVDWWMPVNYADVGIHNATWRNSFGGTIYKSSGSHGCINTPTDAMKIVFEKSFVGMPVIIY